jgi:hypothetical protein
MRDLSGRYDLVDDDGSDLGRANFFLNAGIRYLDRICSVKKSVGRHFTKRTEGTFLVPFTQARTIQTVWMANGDGRFELTPMPLGEMLGQFSKALGDEDKGVPKYWAPACLRPIPEAWTQGDLDNLGDLAGFLDVTVNGNQNYNGVIIMPPLDGTYLVEVWGKWYSTEARETALEAGGVLDPEVLEGQISTNYWSDQHPELVVLGAMRTMEMFNRNMQGSKELDAQIQGMVDEIEKDMVEEETAHIDQMKG